jgi:two-component system response regulator PilR (NtrC family)
MSNERRQTSNTAARVLLVDDEPDILELLELALLRMGLEVDRADGVHAALDCLKQHNYDLCLTDMRMQDGEGLDIVRHITAQNLDLPIAVITAHGNMESAITALKAGAFVGRVSLDQLRAWSAIHVPKPAPENRTKQRQRGPARTCARDAKGARSDHCVAQSGSGAYLVLSPAAVRAGCAFDRAKSRAPSGPRCPPKSDGKIFGYRKGCIHRGRADRRILPGQRRPFLDEAQICCHI